MKHDACAIDVSITRGKSQEGMDPSVVNKIGSIAARNAPKWLVDPLARLVVNRMLAQKEEYSCKLTTVSSIMKTQVIGRKPPLALLFYMRMLSTVSHLPWLQYSQLLSDLDSVL